MVSTAATACVRTALVNFHTKNPTCKHYKQPPPISNAGISKQLRGPHPNRRRGLVCYHVLQELLTHMNSKFLPSCPFSSSPMPPTLTGPYSLEQNIGITVASMPALRQLLVMRRQRFSSQSIQPLYIHRDNNPTIPPRPSLNHFTKLSSSNQIHLTDPNPFTEPNSHEFSTLSPSMPDIEKCDQVNDNEDATRASLNITRVSMVSPPLWTDRKISSASRIEISRVYPQPTFVHRKPSSSAEAVRLSMMAPSRGTHRKTSSADRASRHIRKLSMVPPLSVDRPPSVFASAASRSPQTLGGRFEETGLRYSRVATPEEMMTLGNPASLGYSCMIEGGTPKALPEPTP